MIELSNEYEGRMEETMNISEKTLKIYNLIDSKAGSNQMMQGISGLLGFPYTLIVDAAALVTHYGPMLNDIRKIYSLDPVSVEVIKPIISGCSSEILTDIVIDKILGQIPLLGIGANIICAKTMTWRLGLVFAMLSARGDDISTANVIGVTRLIREKFPPKSMLTFRKPSVSDVNELLCSVSDMNTEDFDRQIDSLLDGLAA